jgi:hypothetical protein
MTTPTNTTTSAALTTQSPVQQVPPGEVTETAPANDHLVADGWTPEWSDRLGDALWQLGASPQVVAQQLDYLEHAQLTTPELEATYASLTRELVLQHATGAWQPGAQVAQQGPPGQVPPVVVPPSQQPPSQWPPQGPPQGPPQVPPPGSEFPTDPTEPPGPPPTKPPTDPDQGSDFSLTPWLIGAGIVGAGVLGAVALHDGARNVRALRATAAAWESGAMHQGGLQSIKDAELGARFTAGIGFGDYLQVALPGVNRIGSGGRLTAAARGHLDHAELLAASTALQRGAGDAVAVHEPLRREVLGGLEEGRSMRSILDGLDRSADGAKPSFDNPQLAKYWDRTSITERGMRVGGHDISSGVSVQRPELALERLFVAGEGQAPTARRQLVETGRTVRIDQLLAGHGADLDGRGLANGIGTIQGVNVSTLNPAMRAQAIGASGVDPSLVDAIGLNGAFTQRWSDRLAAAPPTAATPTRIEHAIDLATEVALP